MNAQQAWQATLGQLQTSMSKAAFDTWVRNTELVSHEQGVFTIGVQNAYARDWLESRLSSTVTQTLTGFMEVPQTVRFIVWQRDYDRDFMETASLADQAARTAVEVRPNPSINPRYTFDSYVVGTNNRLAHAACLAVADNPARAYNPLFLHGGVGLGKTHLLQAIGNTAHQNGLQVMYVSSEEFTNDLINSIRTHNMVPFRERYRRIDVLLIDDIQFIAGKESTQEEFFHTFNTLHGQDKQIVISSDRPPKAMVTLEERLRSRFEGGLIVDIQPPDLETRIAILRSKADRAGKQISNEVLELIARMVQSNIRELEGSLTRVIAFAELSGQAIDSKLVGVALADLMPQRSTLEPRYVLEVVAKAYGVSTERLLGRERSREIVLPRQVAMYLLREDVNVSLPQIGDALGGRDHTTVMYACDKVSDMIERDDRLRKQILRIREQLYGPRSLAF
jgi:chromosomal replication initiator protein